MWVWVWGFVEARGEDCGAQAGWLDDSAHHEVGQGVKLEQAEGRAEEEPDSVHPVHLEEQLDVRHRSVSCQLQALNRDKTAHGYAVQRVDQPRKQASASIVDK
eukprot:SAG11_NODE_354_length_10336_cov_3.789391_5_plen_103_part_00